MTLSAAADYVDQIHFNETIPVDLRGKRIDAILRHSPDLAEAADDIVEIRGERLFPGRTGSLEATPEGVKETTAQQNNRR